MKNPASASSTIMDDVLAAILAVRQDPEAAEIAGISGAAWSPVHPSWQRAELTDFLYRTWFSRQGGPDRRTRERSVDGSLLETLRAAHANRNEYEPGWVVTGYGSQGEIYAARGMAMIRLEASNYMNLSRLSHAVVGDHVAANARQDLADPMTGWWSAMGSAGPPSRGPLVRTYWSCPAPRAPELVARITRDLELRRSPYLIKCPTTPEGYDRADSLVVYLDPDSWRAAKPALAATHRQLAGGLGTDSPPLTLRLGVGVAVAEDPGDGRSFGESRAAAVADGLIRAGVAGQSDDEPIARMVVGGFPAHDISPTQPHLRASSHPASITGW